MIASLAFNQLNQIVEPNDDYDGKDLYKSRTTGSSAFRSKWHSGEGQIQQKQKTKIKGDLKIEFLFGKRARKQFGRL